MCFRNVGETMAKRKKKKYAKKKTAYKKIKQNFTFFHNHFHFTINNNMIVYLIKNKNSLYKIMKTLKKKYNMFTKTH